MAVKSQFPPPHEMHRRRFSRNLGVGLTLAAFVILVMALTIVKVTEAGPMLGLDLQPAPTAGTTSP